MTITISTPVGDTSINSTEPVIVTQTGIVDGTNGLSFEGGSDPGTAIVAGSVLGTAEAVSMNGDDFLTITATGLVAAQDGVGADGVRVFGTGNVITVQGTILALDAGIIAFNDSDMLVTISSSGLVQGGSNGRGADGGAYSAAIASSSSATIENAGTIIGDFNPENGLRIAILNGGVADAAPTGFDLSGDVGMVVKNSGTIIGDILLGAGVDTYESTGGGIVDGTISMGDGDDVVRGGQGLDVASGGSGNDEMRGGAGNDAFAGGTGDDELRGGRDDDTLRGGGGNDVIRGGSGEDGLTGAGGDDDIRGGSGEDTIQGGGGSDKIAGGAGDDKLSGNGGFDTFIFKGRFGIDTITDFATSNQEKINLAAVTSIANFNDLANNHLSQIGSDALIEDGLGNQIILEDLEIANLQAGDFIF